MQVHQHGYNVNIRLKPRGEFPLERPCHQQFGTASSLCNRLVLQQNSSSLVIGQQFFEMAKKSHTNFLHVVRFGVAGRGWFWLVVVGCVLVAVGRGGYGGCGCGGGCCG